MYALFQFSSFFFQFEGFQLVSLFDVTIAVDGDAAFEAGSDFLHVILEAAQRCDLAFMDDDAVTDQAQLAIAGDLAVLHVGTGDDDLRCVDDLTDFRMAEDHFADGRRACLPSLP